MEGKKDKFKGFVELKKFAAEKILRIASNKLFIDIRKVRRFRIWQGEYLDHVMHGIAVKDSEKQFNLKRKYFRFLDFLLLKRLQKSLYKWSSKVRMFKIFALPNAKFQSAIKIIEMLLGWDLSFISQKDFPLFYISSNNWKGLKVRIALFKWKEKVVTVLLNEARKEKAVIRINHFLHKKTTPLISFAIRKICYRAGAKLGCTNLIVTLKSLILSRKHLAFIKLNRRKGNLTPKNRLTRDKKGKIQLLQKFASIKKLNMIINKNFQLELSTLRLFTSFMHWKKFKKRLIVSKFNQKLKGPTRKIKNLSIKYLFYKNRCLIKHYLRFYIQKWLKNIHQSKEFPIDKNVYINQAHVSSYIEGQILSTSIQIKNLKKLIKIQNLSYILKKNLRQIFEYWINVIESENKNTRQADVAFEYVNYLEDHLGLPHKFRN